MTQRRPEPLDYETPRECSADAAWGIFALGFVPLLGCCLVGGHDMVLGDPPDRGAFVAYHVATGLIVLAGMAWLVCVTRLAMNDRLPKWTIAVAMVWIAFLMFGALIFISETRSHPAGRLYLSQ